LKMNCSGLCASDIHFMMEDIGMAYSAFGVRSPGHNVFASTQLCFQTTQNIIGSRRCRQTRSRHFWLGGR
jgi:hypothetical protein